ncbi:hypothetical protein ACFQBQ_09105 [Granulicella cerasi]|uniref:Uncharacterized protein n=1 Tax=Granulicella cerasi TaxID=741063 RepID=A0ABW1ZA54_9BACT|nr:hypothetical protein [Granulicella cerasi]
MNYFEYFSEIEDRFNARRGSLLMLSTLDWALIETWREAGIPLEAVLRGIDRAFDKYDAKAARAKGRTRKVNGLAWASQAVMEAAEEAVEAATGAPLAASKHEAAESGFEHERVAAFLERNAAALQASKAVQLAGSNEVVSSAVLKLRAIAAELRSDAAAPLDELDRTLTVMEERLVAAVRQAASEDDLVQLREQAERELAPYRAKMAAPQLKQIVAQFEQKRLMEMYRLPRLSLFYMGHE